MRILPRRLLLRLRYPQRDFIPIRSCHERTFFLCGRKASEDMPESNGVGAHTEGGAPFFRDDLGEAGYAGFGEAVVGLPARNWLVLVVRRIRKYRGNVRVAVDAAGAADVNDVSGLAVFDSEIRGCCSYEFEGRGVVESEDGIPLLVCHLNTTSH